MIVCGDVELVEFVAVDVVVDVELVEFVDVDEPVELELVEVEAVEFEDCEVEVEPVESWYALELL